MKKQLLIAAIAASMTSVAMADVSISGAMFAKYANVDNAPAGTADTNTLTHETDLDINGSFGDTSVNIHMDANTGNSATFASTITTKIIDGLTVKAGTYAGGKSVMSAKSGAATKSLVTYDAGIAKVTWENNASGTSNNVGVSGSVEGIALSFNNKKTQDEFKVSGSVAGVAFAFHNIDADGSNTDKNSYEISGDVSGVTLTYAAGNADSAAQIDGDAFFGNTASISGNGDDFSGFSASTDLAGNTVTFKHFKQDSATATRDATTNKFTVVRALAGGTTLTANYAALDVNNGTTGDKDTFDIKLAVSF